MIKQWFFNEYDLKYIQDLSGFLPEKIFDIHAHIYRVSDLNISEPSNIPVGPAEVSIDVWKEHLTTLLNGRELSGGLFFPYPVSACDINRKNAYLLSQLESARELSSRGLVLVSPGTSPAELSELLSHTKIIGMKPYHVFSNEQPTWESSVRGYFPEWQWELADKHECIVVLHLVKRNAVADPDNIREIREICSRYPSIRLILAHAARCFHSPHAKEGIRQLRGLNNIWFDTSAVCEPDALMVILREFGPEKLMWGSDFPVSLIRGKCISIGDGFVWLEEDTLDWEKQKFSNPLLVGIESLLAIRNAAEEFGLNREDLTDIFCNNAERLVLRKDIRGATGELYRHAKERIPGGVQLLSKRPEMMAPDRWPAYFSEARGCEVWDMDGNHYYDMATNGIGSCLLGFNDPDVNRALRRRINLGSMCSLNPPEEVELADVLCDIHPWAEQVRFTRSGGEACAVAVRIARATTDRSVIAVCGYHGWHDWYLAANLGESDSLRGHLLPGLNPLGVPAELRDTTVTFPYNDKQALQSIIDKYGKRLAAVIMEPCRNNDPEPGFLAFVREVTRKCGALLIFDEITIGWRLFYGGAHIKFEVFPDMAVFAKALGNGVPIGAIIGTKPAMEGANESFISSTYWTESLGSVAALATLKKMKSSGVPDHIAKIGNSLMNGWQSLGERHKLPVKTSGYPCLAHFSFDHKDAEKLRTLYTIKMLSKGFLAGASIYPTMAHNMEIAGKYINAVDEVFAEIAEVINTDKLDHIIDSKIAHSGFKRLL